MKTIKCKQCGTDFDTYAIVDGKKRNLSARSFCLTCSPFNEFSKSGNPKPVIDGQRECKVCKIPKPLSEFKLKNGAFRPYCSECSISQSTKWWKEHPEKKMLSSARSRAKRDNLQFNLTIDDIVIPEFCPVLGMKMERCKGLGHAKDNSPSLDKITPEKGYVKGNVCIISHKANKIKSNASINDLQKVLDYMKSFQPITDK